MKKRFCILYVLAVFCCSLFAQKKLNVGNYESWRGIKINCYDNFTVRISDSNEIEIILSFMDVDSTAKAGNAIRGIVTNDKNKINSIYDMLKFLDKNKIKYEYQQYNNSSNYYIVSQAFVEEYLVPRYKISSGVKRIFNSYILELNDWNKEKCHYDYCLYTYTYLHKTIEFKDWNQEIENYDYKVITCSYYTVKYNNWNKDIGMYEYELTTYPDYTEERKDLNKDTKHYDYILDSCSDYTVEYKIWNSEYSSYDYKNYVYKDYTSEWRRKDGTYFDIDVKDNEENIIAYNHIISPLKNGMRNIEVLSENVIYRYIGVREDKDTVSFMSCIKIENGEETNLGGGTLSYDDFYRNDKYLLND